MNLIRIVTSKPFCLLCFIFGLFWFLSLSQMEFSHKTYMSENALLVGLIKKEFNNYSAINTFYKDILAFSKNEESSVPTEWLKETMEGMGLDVGVQKFQFSYDKLFPYQRFDGQNVYGILRSPGAARMQSILISTSSRLGKDKSLAASIATMLALAQHCRNKLYWAMDIIFLFVDMEYVGLKAWLNAYHGLTNASEYIKSSNLFPRSGSILAGINLEIQSQTIPYVEFRVENLNGQLTNLDLFNALVRLSADNQIPVRIHGVPPPYSDSLMSRNRCLRTMLSMMWHQSSGSPTGLHGLLADFQIPALTVFSPSNNNIKSQATLFDITRLLESALRCLNSLQERFHQSFFFYILPQSNRYVSIGMYMLPFGVMCGGPLLLSVIASLVYFHGYSHKQSHCKDQCDASPTKSKISEVQSSKGNLDWIALGTLLVCSSAIGFFTNVGLDHFLRMSHKFKVTPGVAVVMGSLMVTAGIMFFFRLKLQKNSVSSVILLRTATHLGLGLFLGALSVLNISMAFFIGLCVVPYAVIVYPYRYKIVRLLCCAYLMAISPLSLLYIAAIIHVKYFDQFNGSILSAQFHSTAFSVLQNLLMKGWVERDVLGSWTNNILILGYLPFWVMLWCITCLNTPAN